VIEFGPPNATIHKSNECIAVEWLQPMKNVYRRTLEALLPAGLGGSLPAGVGDSLPAATGGPAS
jgi:hypothetical protein